MSKGKDIQTMFTREENKKNGRLGYGLATKEKEDVISPARETGHRAIRSAGIIVLMRLQEEWINGMCKEM